MEDWKQYADRISKEVLEKFGDEGISIGTGKRKATPSDTSSNQLKSE